MTTNFGRKLNLANWQIITKPPNIIFANNNYYYHRRLLRLLFGVPFPLCIKSEHAAEIYRGTCPITFALFLIAPAYGSNALLSSMHLTWKVLCCSRRPNVLIHVKSHVVTQLSTTCVSIIFVWNEFCDARCGVSIENMICNSRQDGTPIY